MRATYVTIKRKGRVRKKKRSKSNERNWPRIGRKKVRNEKN